MLTKKQEMSAVINFKVKYQEFAVVLREEINEYFKKNNISKFGNWRLYSKTIILFSILFLCYASCLFFPIHWSVQLLNCALMGIVMAGIGFNVMHDGAHGSYSKYTWLNEIMAHSLNFMGGAVYLWKQKHNVIHHNYTNIEGVDDDIDIRPLIRTNANQPKKAIHKFQHLYFLPLYTFTSIWWIFFRDFLKYFTGKIASVTYPKMDVKQHFIFWISKIIHIGFFIGLPMYIVGVVPTIIGYIFMLMIQGLILAIVFQMAHVVDETTFPMPEENSNVIDNTVVMHQLETTANFSMNSKIVSWFTGGLNYQIEHHLFPKISHIHYPELSKIVKNLCSKYGVNYIEFPTFYSVFRSHFLHLKKLGQ